MNDEQFHEPGSADAAEAESLGERGNPNSESLLEDRQPVFGKWRYWTTLIPFIVWYAAVTNASYLDWIREEALVKDRMPGHEETHFGEFPEEEIEDMDIPDETGKWFPTYQTWYPQLYSIGMGVVVVFMLIAIPGYCIPDLRITWLSFVVGTVGVVVWVGLILIDREYIGLGSKLSGVAGREAFNPFEALKETPTWMYTFLAIRFAGLVLIVPIVEEFFLRGFLMRYIDDPDWDLIPLGVAAMPGILGSIGYGAFAHAGEGIAALAWFSMMTWMYLRTKSIWDCVVAHAITNLLLGIYIVQTDSWELW